MYVFVHQCSTNLIYFITIVVLINMVEMKSIGISENVYKELLQVKHLMEKQESRVISYDEVIFQLIRRYGNDD